MDREKLLQRVRHLLAMSKDASSPNEAAIAARRARKLIDDYQINEMDLTSVKDTEFGKSSYENKNKTNNSAISVMSVAVAQLNDCQVRYDRNRFTGANDIVFEGLLVDTVSSVEMLLWLKDLMYRLAVVNAKGRADRHAYRLGFASGISQQVDDILKERNGLKTSNGTALVVVKSQLVRKKFGVVSYSKSKSKYSGAQSARQKGYVDGKDTALNRQMRQDKKALSHG